MDIEWVWERKQHCHLDSTNAVPMRAKLLYLWPEGEAWPDVHLDELVDKRVIGPILLG